MRRLSENFINQLKTGFLSKILQLAIDDYDICFDIRKDYINLYYKGHSLLKLTEDKPEYYSVDIHSKFIDDLRIPSNLINAETTQQFLDSVPYLKRNIQKVSNRSLEIEYEQMIIRANNYEMHNNTEYFIIDRQYANSDARFDLIGFFWKRNRRRKYQEVDLCLMEVKLALNHDISSIHDQLDRYYKSVMANASSIVDEASTVLTQKLELGLFRQSPERLEAMKTLKISKDVSRFQFIVFLIDYNPHSKLFVIEKLRSLSFSDQIKIFNGGFALWQKNLKDL